MNAVVYKYSGPKQIHEVKSAKKSLCSTASNENMLWAPKSDTGIEATRRVARQVKILGTGPFRIPVLSSQLSDANNLRINNYCAG